MPDSRTGVCPDTIPLQPAKEAPPPRQAESLPDAASSLTPAPHTLCPLHPGPLLWSPGPSLTLPPPPSSCSATFMVEWSRAGPRLRAGRGWPAQELRPRPPAEPCRSPPSQPLLQPPAWPWRPLLPHPAARPGVGARGMGGARAAPRQHQRPDRALCNRSSPSSLIAPQASHP